jgi:hypothetical protein
MKRALNWIFNGPWWSTFFLMGLFAWALGVSSYNLMTQLSANFRYIATFGWMAAMEGGLMQFGQLALLGYLSLTFYVLFKGCLQGLLGRFGRH